MADGLDSLKAQYARSRRPGGRSIPPPVHGPRETPVNVAVPDVPTAADQKAPLTAPTPLRATTKPAKSTEAVEPLAKRTIHLSPTDDGFLDAVFMAGRQHPAGRFDASRSAVVR